MVTSQQELERPEPEVGNYFVSAYPPFSCWKPEEVGQVQKVLDLQVSSQRDVPFGLYIHTPFCMHRCQFCYYRSFAGKTRAEIDGYVDSVLAELSIYGSQPALTGRKLDFAYFGGGTPSILSAEQIERLLSGVQSNFPWTDVKEVSFECAPKTTTRRRLQLLRQLGVTRISLGVQQLDDEVLQQNGRVHLVHDVERAYEAIQQAAFPTVNVDLIVGLVGESEATLFNSLDRIIDMSPTSVTLYPLEIPPNTPLYGALEEGTVLQETPPSWHTKRDRLSRAFSRLERAGYVVQTAYAAVRDADRNRFVYQDAQYHGADVLGAGVASFSYLSGVHFQNAGSLDTYRRCLSLGELPLKRAYMLSVEERTVREFVLQLKLGRVDAEYFRNKFDIEIGDVFAAPLEKLSREGWLTVNDRGIDLTREGLLRADRLIAEFYLDQHRNCRFW